MLQATQETSTSNTPDSHETEIDPVASVVAELDTYPTMKPHLLFEHDVFAVVDQDELRIFTVTGVSHAGVSVEGVRSVITFRDLGRITLLQRRGESTQYQDQWGQKLPNTPTLAAA